MATPRRIANPGRRRIALDVVCYSLALVLVGFQLAMIVYARFDDARYFAWAPHDVSWSYQMSVEVGGRTLEHEEAVGGRYKLRRWFRHEHAIEHVIRAVRQYEQTYGKDDDARVVLTYHKNGHEDQEMTWTWPEE